MSVPPTGEVGARSALGSGARSSLGPGDFPLAGPRSACVVHRDADGDHEALARGIVATGAGGVGVAEPVVRGVEEPLEHHRVWYTREVPLCVPVRGRRGSSLAEPWYNSSLVVAMRFRTASRWWPGRSSYAATSVLADEL
jgi:hypothetical protein